jgi:hypothetical protein
VSRQDYVWTNIVGGTGHGTFATGSEDELDNCGRLDPSSEAQMKRPIGVTIVAAVMVLAGVFFGLAGLAFFAMGSTGAMTVALSNAGLAAVLTGLGAAGGVIFLLFGVLHVVLAMGLLKLRNPARVLTMLLFALSAVGAIVGLLVTLARFNLIGLGWDSAVIVLDLWIIWYLIRPHVKEVFSA